MPSKKNKNGIPDRWLDYRAVGKRIPGTRFIAFKVPLKQSLNCRVPESDTFGPWELLDALKKDNQDLGLIIDLTFTSRYYNQVDLPMSWSFVKILTEGHRVPGNATILSFKRAVRKFLWDNPDNDKLIGVHCTHGLNRTGYLVCRYLIDVDMMDPKKAIELFNSSRGHHIERENYLQDLQFGPRRSNQGIDKCDQEPMRGLAEVRPSSVPIGCKPREQRPQRTDDPDIHGALTRRGSRHQLFPRPPQCDLLQPSPFLPHSTFAPLGAPYRTGPPNPPHQWNPFNHDTQWRWDLQSGQSRHRFLSPEPGQSSSSLPGEDISRGHYSAAPPDSLLSGYPLAFLTDQTDQNISKQKTRPKKKAYHKYKHRK
ncbi:RNA/RNP complex-1-interacting phosphatase-like [Polymixia lowei]